MMRKYIAITCLAVFCVALFVAAAHDHGAAGPQLGCAICLMSLLSFAAKESIVNICQSWTRFQYSYQTSIILSDARSASVAERAPPA